MNFIEAMNLVHQNPAGPTAKAVTRPGKMLGFVYYDSSKFLGVHDFGFRITVQTEVVGSMYSPCIDDINATDWEEKIL